MFFAYWMVLAAAFLPYVATVYSKRGDTTTTRRASSPEH